MIAAFSHLLNGLVACLRMLFPRLVSLLLYISRFYCPGLILTEFNRSTFQLSQEYRKIADQMEAPGGNVHLEINIVFDFDLVIPTTRYDKLHNDNRYQRNSTVRWLNTITARINLTTEKKRLPICTSKSRCSFSLIGRPNLSFKLKISNYFSLTWSVTDCERTTHVSSGNFPDVLSHLIRLDGTGHIWFLCLFSSF